MLTFAELQSFVAHEKPNITIDSRTVTPGSVFIAVPGTITDGSAFIASAISSGADYVVCRPEDAVHCAGAIAVPCETPRKVVGQLAASRYQTLELPFPVVGVTGTNGKTTVTYLLDHLFASAGYSTGVMGTVSYRWPGHNEEAPMTTPDCLDVHAMLASMRQAGVTAAFMEVSSHALDQFRVDGVPFSGAVFTNLTQDHLDYHGSFTNYFAAKARFFTEMPRHDKVMAVCTDGEWGQKLCGILADAPHLVGYGLQPCPDCLSHLGKAQYVRGEVLESTTSGLRLRVSFNGRTWETRSSLIGGYNAENLLAVEALALGMGLSENAFACFETFSGVPGRLERIQNPQGLDVFVDFAHTPDALENMLEAVRGAGFRRVLCVFGCGGNRDRAKRPLMGEVVGRLADVAVLTSDNPRSEDPELILNDVRPGLVNARAVVVEVDRKKAIAKALELLQPGDALVVAGKGHENTQQIGTVKHSFSDQQTIRELLGCA